VQEGSTRWNKAGHHKGMFGDYTVMGFKYRDGEGRIGWHITSWRTGFDPVHDYWVAGRDFHSVSIHYFYKGAPLNLIEIYDPPITAGIEAEERDAVLRAIGEWEEIRVVADL